jgi:hypothetical protein
MSKFADKLKRVYKSTGQTIGFRKQSADEELPSILLMADVTSSTAKRIKDVIAAGVEGLLTYHNVDNEENAGKIGKAAGDVALGIALIGTSNRSLLDDKDKYDFIITDLKAAPDVLSGEDTGKFLAVTETIMPGMIKAINDLDINIDGVILDYKDSPIDIQFLLTCHLFGDLLNKPLLVKIYKTDITVTELKALRAAEVRALLLPGDISAEQIKAIKKSISSLPVSTRKSKGETPLIPGFGFGQKEVEETEESEEEE